MLNPDWFRSPPAWHSPDVLRRDFPTIDTGYRVAPARAYPERDFARDAAPAVAAAVARSLAAVEGNVLFVGHGWSVLGVIWALGFPGYGRPVELTALHHFRGRGGAAWAYVLDGCAAHLIEG